MPPEFLLEQIEWREELQAAIALKALHSTAWRRAFERR